MAALIRLVLATLLMIVSTAVATPAPEFPGSSGGPVLGAAAAGPSAVAIRSDARVLALRGSHGAGELDLQGGHQLPLRSPDAVAGWSVAAAVSVPLRAGAARLYQGRAPPHTR